MNDQARAVIDNAVEALNEAGVLVLMPLKVKQIPEGSKVHLSPPIVSLNWPEGAYRPFVNGDSRVYVNAFGGTSVRRHLESAVFFLAIGLFGVGIGIVSSLDPSPASGPAAPVAQILSPTTEILVTTNIKKRPIVRRAMSTTTTPSVGYGGVGAR
jgi:hypothetical protein